jgi:hypothetical protein
VQVYSNPEREDDTYALPDVEVFQLTATEVAESSMYEDEQHEFMQRSEFRLAAMNSRAREQMLDAMVAELGITGGWFYWYCLPGCMPDSEPFGPFASADEAKSAAQEDAP